MVDGVSNTAAVRAKPTEKAVTLFFASLSTETPGEAAVIRHATKVAGWEHLLSEQTPIDDRDRSPMQIVVIIMNKTDRRPANVGISPFGPE